MAPTPKHRPNRCNADNLAAKKSLLSDGWDKIPRTLLQSPALSPAAKLVFTYLIGCVKIQGSGMCFPAIPTIARGTGISESTARRSVRELDLVHLILSDHVSGKSTRYTLTPVNLTGLSGHDTPVNLTGHPCQNGGGTPVRMTETPVKLTPEVDVVSRVQEVEKEVDVPSGTGASSDLSPQTFNGTSNGTTPHPFRGVRSKKVPPKMVIPPEVLSHIARMADLRVARRFP